jgi:hypothetical protein
LTWMVSRITGHVPPNSSDDPVALCRLSAYRQSRCFLVGLGFAFSRTDVEPMFQQSRVVYLIHRRSDRSLRRAWRMHRPKYPVFVFTNPGLIPRLRPWP